MDYPDPMDLPDYTERVQPEDLIRALITAGWAHAGGRTGVYARLHWPANNQNHRPESIVVPLDRAAGEYGDLLNATIAQLADLADRGAHARRVLDAILPSEIYFTTDGDTLWVECFLGSKGDEHGHPIHPISPGDTWADVAAKVADHQHDPDGNHPDEA